MDTSLFMWSSSSANFADVDAVDSVPLSLQPPAPSIPKQTKRRASAATKNPQRGLGVAQLERIRLQGSSAVFADEPGAAGGGAYSYHPFACRLGAPVGYGSGSSSVIRSALQEQYSADRVRIGGSGGCPLLFPAELPSKQRGTATTTQRSCHCDCCIRRRVFCENLGFHGTADADAYFPSTIEERKERFTREIKEYEFFPSRSGGGDLVLGDRTAAGASSSVDDGSFLDLSLRL